MTLIERQPASHWYLRDGQPFYEIARRDGEGTRPVSLADARRMLALPSVTNVLGIIAKPALDAWKIEQGIMAALTLPKMDGEPLDGFAKRVVADMGQQVKKAADFGSAIHAACELYALKKEKPEDKTLWPFLEMWWRWFDESVERIDCVERVFVNLEHGYAGKIDMLAKLKGGSATGPCWAVVDFKTQKVKRDASGNAKPAFYETWALQLAAYQQAILSSHANDVEHLVSVVIDSAQPGPVYVKQWSEADYFKIFLSALEVWKYAKSYSPIPLLPAASKPELN